MPGAFLPAAERYDIILKIDRWVVQRTQEWLAEHKAHMETLAMCSINVSRRSLTDPSFHQFAAELVDASNVPAQKLCFEITGSFSYLKQLPVDFIKIDASFIQMMSSSQVDFEMLRFANDISHIDGPPDHCRIRQRRGDPGQPEGDRG